MNLIHDVDVYADGDCYLSCCAPVEASLEQVTEAVNTHTSANRAPMPWAPSKDELFACGRRTNPCVCELDDSRMHYLFER